MESHTIFTAEVYLRQQLMYEKICRGYTAKKFEDSEFAEPSDRTRVYYNAFQQSSLSVLASKNWKYDDYRHERTFAQ